MKYIVTIFFLIASTRLLFAQNHKEAFSKFKETHQQDYNVFVDQIDKDFADFLRQNWEEFEIHKGRKLMNKLKPKSFPKAIEETPTSDQLELAPTNNKSLERGLVMPVNYKESTFDQIPSISRVDFFGEKISVKYVPDFKLELSREIAPEVIAKFWEQISALDYRLTLNDLFFYKNKFGLNDYGYYLLIKEFSESICENSNQAILTTWYLLAKAKFKAKIGYNENEIFMLLPSQMQVYGTSYFDLDGVTYYVMDYSGNKLMTYEENYELSYKFIDFSITEKLKLPEDIGYRRLECTFQDQDYAFDLTYNLNAVNFYNEYPQIELNGYFNSTLTQIASESIIEKIQPEVDKMDEYEAVNFLLALVQNGFEYKIDQDQFGKEKAFFPEEILHYPFSDCEDRSVFFAYLVSTLLGNDVIGLDYPTHVATAVNFDVDVPGDFYFFNNKKYIVCDPTYVNAPVGVSMKDLSATKAELILKTEDHSTAENLMTRIKELFGIKGNIDLPKSMEVESGKIVAANFSGNLYVQNKLLMAEGNSMFTAMFDENNQLKWAKSADNGSQLIDLSYADQDAYILYQNDLELKNYSMLSKLDAGGNVSWKTIIKKMVPVYGNSNTQVTLYSLAGERLAGKTYSESEFFKEKKLSIKNDKVLVILPMTKK